MSKGEKRQRIELIDALRGFSVVLMVIHHLLYNIYAFLGAPYWIFSNPVFDILHLIFAGLFITLSGVSSRFSRGNIQRGLKVIALAIGITIVTWFMNMPILFGVLHLLGFSMLFFGLAHKLWDKIPRKAAGAVFIALIIGSSAATSHIPVQSGHLWIFGWWQPGFVSYDYFPLFPWLFVFLFGTWAGQYIQERRLPDWFYKTRNIRWFPAIGQKALLIYILHQPILYGLVMGIAFLMRR